MIIVGDVGGTKTDLALYDPTKQDYKLSHLKRFASKNYPHLSLLLNEYLNTCEQQVDIQKTGLRYGCFAIAGPVENQRCHTTNLPWEIDSLSLATTCHLEKVFLLNDVEAQAYFLVRFSANLITLYSGKIRKDKQANCCLLSVGTGLGEASLYCHNQTYYPMASEGGHCDFAPRTALEIEFLRYMHTHFDHLSYERVLSGVGFGYIYAFFRDECKYKIPDWLAQEVNKGDPAEIITRYAIQKQTDVCMAISNFFLSVLGAESANSALKYMALGGVYLGGGIPAKILPLFKSSPFYASFLDKGRFQKLLSTIPVHVITDKTAALKGSAYYCSLQLKAVQAE